MVVLTIPTHNLQAPVPQAHMSSNAMPQPIWGDVPSPQGFNEAGLLCNEPRAGGRFLLMVSGAALLRPLTDRQRANLSYWIYHHNLRYRLFDESPGRGETPLVLNEDWVEGYRNRTPSSSDRMLTFLRELIRNDDTGQEPLEESLRAAGCCWRDEDLEDLFQHAMELGLIRGLGNVDNGYQWVSCLNLARPSLEGRIFVEEQLGEQGRSRQGFVAMWFDPSMDSMYESGIKPAIEAAGYEARRIDRKEFVGGVVDEIMAEIRKSRFVVADFTTSPEAGVRGGVYFEAGFAYGLDIPVFLTCHKDCTKAVHFDIDHLNRLEWETPEDLRKRLPNRIEAVLGRGPFRPSTERRGSAGEALD